jgi:hypothetical protein
MLIMSKKMSSAKDNALHMSPANSASIKMTTRLSDFSALLMALTRSNSRGSDVWG